jgi:hypothetical protein
MSALESEPTAAAEANQAEVPPSRARTGAVAGGTQALIHGVVTPVVKLRKLTRELINCFPDPSAKPVLQTKGLSRNWSVSGPFFSSKIVQKSCKSLQKRAKNDRKSGFLATDFIKTCQVRWLVSSLVSVGATRRRHASGVSARSNRPGYAQVSREAESGIFPSLSLRPRRLTRLRPNPPETVDRRSPGEYDLWAEKPKRRFQFHGC